MKVKVSCSVMSDSLRSHRLYSPWNSPGQNTRVGSLFLLQGIFPTQGLNPGVLHCRRILYRLSHQGMDERVAYILVRVYKFRWSNLYFLVTENSFFFIFNIKKAQYAQCMCAC